MQKLKPLMPSLFELVISLEEGDEEEDMKENISGQLSSIVQVSNEILAPYLDKMIDWYIKKPSADLAGMIRLTWGLLDMRWSSGSALVGI